MKFVVLVLAAALRESNAQAWCCNNNACSYFSTMPQGIPCFGSQTMCTQSDCGSDPGPHNTCWQCSYGQCHPCGCDGVCSSGDYPYWSKSDCDSRCAQPDPYWLCVYGCNTTSQCYTMASCESASASPCSLEKAAASCPGQAIFNGPVLSFKSASICKKQQQTETQINEGCKPVPKVGVMTKAAKHKVEGLVNKSAPKANPCAPDPNGEKEACLSDCAQCLWSGPTLWCKNPPVGGGFGCDVGSDCFTVGDENDCLVACNCKTTPPPLPGQCPQIPYDKEWNLCSDSTHGGNASCHWCESNKQCVPNNGQQYPLGYDPKCGEPPADLMGGHNGFAGRGPLTRSLSTAESLCTYACSDGTSLFRCMLGSCPSTYNSCQRADCYQFSADRCNGLSMYMYQADGQTATNRFIGHHSVAGNALANAGLELMRRRKLALTQGEIADDVTPAQVAAYVSKLEDDGLDAAEAALCAWAGAAPDFCKFIIGTSAVQWVNGKILNLPIVAQVTHQIATEAAGAIDEVQNIVKQGLQDVANAINAAEGVLQAAAKAATSIVHSVLGFFGFIDFSQTYHMMLGREYALLGSPADQAGIVV